MSEPTGRGQADAGQRDQQAAREVMLWGAADGMVDRAHLAGILAHKLGPLAANRIRRVGGQVPKPLQEEERAAALAMMSAGPLIARIRAATDAPLVVLKGPLLAKLYPGQARRFIDLDVLTTDADSLQRTLLAVGFIEDPDPDQHLMDDHHHLEPIRWPAIPLKVEVHARASMPERARKVPAEEILEASIAAGLGIDGVLAPAPLHHALILASHAWLHAPLTRVRDLIDIAAVSGQANEADLAKTAAAWGISRLWRTTCGAIESLFFGAPPTMPLRTWARHLGAVRERTVAENHLQRWAYAFWELPPHAALAGLPRVFRDELAPAAGETGREKRARMIRAMRSPLSSAPRASSQVPPQPGKRDLKPPSSS